jgi:hypothetical protein
MATFELFKTMAPQCAPALFSAAASRRIVRRPLIEYSRASRRHNHASAALAARLLRVAQLTAVGRYIDLKLFSAAFEVMIVDPITSLQVSFTSQHIADAN